jgi:hypothetical protein
MGEGGCHVTLSRRRANGEAVRQEQLRRHPARPPPLAAPGQAPSGAEHRPPLACAAHRAEEPVLRRIPFNPPPPFVQPAPCRGRTLHPPPRAGSPGSPPPILGPATIRALSYHTFTFFGLLGVRPLGGLRGAAALDGMRQQRASGQERAPLCAAPGEPQRARRRARASMARAWACAFEVCRGYVTGKEREKGGGRASAGEGKGRARPGQAWSNTQQDTAQANHRQRAEAQHKKGFWQAIGARGRATGI